jgi:hypothetical protein
MKYFAQVGEQEYVIEIGQDGEPILIDGEPYAIDFRRMPGSGFVSLLLNNRSLEGVVEQRDGRWEVLIRGNLYDVTVADERTYRLARARGELTAVSGAAAIKSPMPGIIIAVPVQVGGRGAQGRQGGHPGIDEDGKRAARPDGRDRGGGAG